MGSFSLTHILILLLIVIVVTRPSRITDLFVASKKAFRNLRDAKNEIDAEYEEIRIEKQSDHNKDKT